MSKRIYISGAITGTTDYMERFAEAEKSLTEAGYEVVNPSKLCLIMPETATHKEYMDICIPLLKICESIYMLDGWKESKGANIEKNIATESGMKVQYQDETKRDTPQKVKNKGIFTMCPRCEDAVFGGMNYCSVCGQKLKF